MTCFPRSFSTPIGCGRFGTALPQIHQPNDEASLEQATAAVHLSGAARPAAGPGDPQVAAVAPAASAAAADQQQDRRPHHAAVSVRADRGPAAGDRRDRRRHGPAVSDEPPAARRRRQRQDGRGDVRHAAGRGPRPSGGADGPDGNPRPPALANALDRAGGEQSAAGPAHRLADAGRAARDCWKKSPRARSIS